jgi:hypothetical protein
LPGKDACVGDNLLSVVASNPVPSGTEEMRCLKGRMGTRNVSEVSIVKYGSIILK